MAIINRLADLLKANINDMLDKAEDPEKMLKQIIIDMEEQIQEATQGLGALMACERQSEKQLEAVREDSRLWEERAKNALKAGNEELAKKAVEGKLKADGNLTQQQKTHDELSAQVEVIRDQVNQLKQKMNESRTRLSMLVARVKVAEAKQSVAESVGGGAFSKMDEMEEKLLDKEAMADAQYELSGADKKDPYAELAQKTDADIEMDRLKKEMGL